MCGGAPLRMHNFFYWCMCACPRRSSLLAKPRVGRYTVPCRIAFALCTFVILNNFNVSVCEYNKWNFLLNSFACEICTIYPLFPLIVVIGPNFGITGHGGGGNLHCAESGLCRRIPTHGQAKKISYFKNYQFWACAILFYECYLCYLWWMP